MKNGAKMEPIYQQRVEDFFDHIDDNNTIRTYNWLVK